MRRRGRPRHPDILTPREWQVLALLREGVTNEQIAQRLDITYDGAKYHVSEILSKLGVSSREEAAAWTPEERRPLWAGAPLLGSLLGRLSLGTAAKAAGVVVTAAALGGIGLLVWALVVTNGPDEAGPAISQPTATETPADGGAPPRPAAGTIAFISRRDGNAEIYTVEPDGGNPSPLVSDPAEQSNIAWAPDGSRLAFYSRRGERWHLDIVDADGSGLTTIADGLVTGHDPIPPVWSPDGSRLAFESEHEGDMEVYVVDADGTGLTNLTRNSAHDSGPSWSPDGSRIAFSSDRDGNTDIYVMNADGSRGTRLTEHPAVDTAPAWSPHGERIAFMSFRDGEAEIYAVNADGSGLTNATRNPAANFPGGPVGHHPPAWSPDGSRIAFVSNRDGNAEIYVAVADGSGVTRLTEDPADDVSPAWSPDGLWVAFVSSGDVYIVAADGRGSIRLTDALQAVGPPAWQPAPAGMLAGVYDGGLVVLIDISMGEAVGEIGLDYQPWALFRPSAGELLVSDLGGEDNHGRLFVYDLADVSEPKWEMEMPERAAATGYGPAWGLSNDERYLYYTVHPRDELGQPQRLADVVVIVDLEARRETARTQVPSYCPAMSPLGDQDILAMCHNRLVSVTRDGSVSDLVAPPFALSPAPDPRGFWHNAVMGGTHDGDAYLVFGNGEVVFSGNETPVTDLVRGGARLWGSGVWSSGEWRLDDGRALLAVGPPEPETATGIRFDRLLVFDPADPEGPESYDLPDGITHAAPLDSRFVALLRLSNTIYLLDLGSGEITHEFPAPAGVRWLVGP